MPSACPIPSPFCIRWKENFKRALMMGTDNYCNGLPDSVLGALGRSMLPYLTQHAAWRETRQQLPDALVRVVPSDRPPRGLTRVSSAGPVATGLLGSLRLPSRPRAPGSSSTLGPPVLEFERLSMEQSPFTRYWIPGGAPLSPSHKMSSGSSSARRTRRPRR